MLRAILAAVAGYATMFVLVMVSFTGAYLALGADRAFQPGGYEISGTWAAVSLALGLLAAIAGGFVCRLIARSMRPAIVLSAIVLALGLAQAAMIAGAGPPEVKERTGEVGNFEAMTHARTPLWIALVNPIVGAGGVYLGARLREGRGRPAAQPATPPAGQPTDP